MGKERFCDILIVGGGAAGLMAAIGACSGNDSAENSASRPKVVVLEKMPKVGRKIMISGKGRCNFTNMSQWDEFSKHVHPKADFLKPAFFTLPPQKMMQLVEDRGCPCVVERGERVFPQSHKSTDIVDTLFFLAKDSGAEIVTDCEVADVDRNAKGEFIVSTTRGEFISSKLIITTGGLSYPATGSSGDGYRWAREFGHKIETCFPSLTALVPKGYKTDHDRTSEMPEVETFALPTSGEYRELKGHIDRSTPLTEWGRMLAGIQLKNVRLSIETDGNITDSEFGDMDFTDGGIEGPIGFKLSRKAVKAVLNGAKLVAHIDLKPAVESQQLERRIDELWKEISDDKRSYVVIRGKRTLRPYKERFAVLLSKLLPKELIRPFVASNPPLDSRSVGKALKDWKLPIAGYVGYERCVITAGGVSLDEVNKKTLESKLTPGLFFAGELLNLDADTGGYNLQIAFSTGFLSGVGAKK